ncbi:HAD hydrolase-like protein [Agaricicola taiwanensis]|uniref:HAD hydrolase-like protein n=1 Tax=Agaricicola taiwanensis TaxID=591372 RepID=UPI001E53FCAD|nr:HAD hydrolase-like protein [Agaricicola taiwanensis]
MGVALLATFYGLQDYLQGRYNHDLLLKISLLCFLGLTVFITFAAFAVTWLLVPRGRVLYRRSGSENLALFNSIAYDLLSPNSARVRKKQEGQYQPCGTLSLVIFDFDGTIADSAPWFFSVFNGVAAQHGFRQLSEAEGQELRSKSTRDIIAALGIPRRSLSRIARDLRQRNAAASISMFGGVAGLLEQLARRGVDIAVVSSNAEANVRRVLGPSAQHITYFSCGVGLFGKASRFRNLMQGYRKAEVLAIGDETRDIEAARKVKITCAAVTWGYASQDALVKAAPDHLFNDIPDLANWLSGNTAKAATAA